MVLNLASDSNLKSQESDNLVDIVFFPQSQYVQYQTDFHVDILFQKQKVYGMNIVFVETNEFIKAIKAFLTYS